MELSVIESEILNNLSIHYELRFVCDNVRSKMEYGSVTIGKTELAVVKFECVGPFDDVAKDLARNVEQHFGMTSQDQLFIRTLHCHEQGNTYHCILRCTALHIE